MPVSIRVPVEHLTSAGLVDLTIAVIVHLVTDLFRTGVGRRVVVIASSDLTHYGHRYGFAPAGTGPEALEYGRRNDQLLIDEALAMNPSGVLREASEHYNACGSGALAAAISCSTARGADAATLLHYTTSHDSGPEQVRDPSMFVGYASMVFARG